MFLNGYLNILQFTFEMLHYAALIMAGNNPQQNCKDTSSDAELVLPEVINCFGFRTSGSLSQAAQRRLIKPQLVSYQHFPIDLLF